MKAILKNRLYLSVLGLDLLSNFGDSVYYLALMNYVLLLPEPKAAIAIVTLSETLPILSAFVMGYLADKQAQKVPLIIGTQFFRFALYLVVGLLMGFQPALWVVVAVSLLNFLADLSGQFEGSLYQPVSLRVIKPEEREQAMAFSSGIFQTMVIVFKFSGAILVGLMTYQNLAYLNALTFLVCALGMLGLKKRLDSLLQADPITLAPASSDQSFVANLWAGMKQTIREMNKIPILRFGMVVIPILNAIFSSLETFVLLVMAEGKDFGVGSPALTLSIIGVVFMVGGLLGNIVVMSGKVKLDLITILKLEALFSLPLFLSLFFNQTYPFFLILLVANIGSGILNPKVGALVKNRLPEEQLGMIFSGMATYFQLGVILMKVLLSGLLLIFSTKTLLIVMIVLSLCYAGFSLKLTPKEDI